MDLDFSYLLFMYPKRNKFRSWEGRKLVRDCELCRPPASESEPVTGLGYESGSYAKAHPQPQPPMIACQRELAPNSVSEYTIDPGPEPVILYPYGGTSKPDCMYVRELLLTGGNAGVCDDVESIDGGVGGVDDGEGECVEGDVDADADGETDEDADGEIDADADGETDEDADADGETDEDADADGETDEEMIEGQIDEDADAEGQTDDEMIEGDEDTIIGRDEDTIIGEDEEIIEESRDECICGEGDADHEWTEDEEGGGGGGEEEEEGTTGGAMQRHRQIPWEAQIWIYERILESKILKVENGLRAWNVHGRCSNFDFPGIPCSCASLVGVEQTTTPKSTSASTRKPSTPPTLPSNPSSPCTTPNHHADVNTDIMNLWPPPHPPSQNPSPPYTNPHHHADMYLGPPPNPPSGC